MSQPTNARVKTVLNDYFMPLPTTAAPADGAKFPGQMLWEFTNNGKVVFKADDKVYNPNDQTSYRKKECEMTIYDRNMIFDYLLDAANNPNFDNVKYIIKRRGFIRQGNQSKLSDQPMSQGEFTIIRDNEGVISLGYTRGDYKILFKFSAPGFNETLFKEGGEWKPNPGRASQAWVRSYVTACRRLIDLKEFEIYQPPKPRNNNNNGGNNNNNNNGNYNNNNQSNNNFDDIDDIDF